MSRDLPLGVMPLPIEEPVDEATLPPGRTCAACAHLVRCAWFMGRDGCETSCDWTPSRFRLAVLEDDGEARRGE